MSLTKAFACVIRRPPAGCPELLVFDYLREDGGIDGRAQLPKGGVDPGESIDAAARRELTEETGVDAALVEPIGRLPDREMRDPWDPRPDRTQTWHLFVFAPAGISGSRMADEWVHCVTGDGIDNGKVCRCRWQPLTTTGAAATGRASIVDGIHPLFHPLVHELAAFAAGGPGR